MLRLLYKDLSKTGILTTSSEAIGFPKENIRNPSRTKTWRSSGNSEQWLKWDLLSAEPFNCIALLNTNLTSEATIQFQANATDSWSAPTLDVSLTFNSKVTILFFPVSSLRWQRLLITDASVSYIELGIIHFSQYYEPVRNYSKKWSHSLIDPSTSTETPGGQSHVDKKPQYNTVTLPLKYISDDTKFNGYLAILKEIGSHTDFILSTDPENHPNDMTFYGKFLSPFAVNNIQSTKDNSRHSLTLKFKESL